MAYLNSTVSFEKMLLKFISEEDPMQSMLKWLCERLMEAEVNSKLCAEKSERNKERQGYRSGYRVRRFDTRMGTIYLMVPKIRNGGYIPFFVESKKRSEAALMNVIQEAYVNGVSTRKIDKLAKSLGIESISRGQVSVITKELNKQVDAFRNRPLDSIYPVLWVDALYERIRDTQQVKNMAVIVVTGITTEGKRDILAVEPMCEESATTYTRVFDRLKERGVEQVCLVVSDAQKGLVKAAREAFIGCSWQRCKVHFMRNILAYVSDKNKKAFAEKLKQIWLQPDYESAQKYANELMNDYEAQYPRAILTLEDGLEDSLQFFSFQEIDARKISSTNLLERLNKEIRRRTKVVGIFPSMDSYVRLVTSYLMEYSEDWSSGRSYMNPKIITEILLSKIA
ncbi:Transposase (or an inactivated derivative) [Megasphaera paucivorans]|uniref:Mutator family transposase n=1 Tax=Megasphaera paucivorans TaxID=349095 RepID=A0A1H0AAX0_9FIRM|nr:IS256 family transposase [Megasphaera paucivorans]SDN30792.1 Transposase (or an inactivated derivative) [Megasphaera paucivorans]